MWSLRGRAIAPSSQISRLSLLVHRRKMTTLRFAPLDPNFNPKHIVTIGAKALLASADVADGSAATAAAAAVVRDGHDKSAKIWEDGRSFTFAELDTKTSRNLGTVRADLVHKLVQKHVPSKDDVQLNVLLSGEDQVLAVTSAIARAFPSYTRKSSEQPTRTINISLSAPSALPSDAYTPLNTLATAVRRAAHLVDTPTSELNTSALVREVEAVAARHAATVKATIIAGEDLLQHGLGALYGVGKAATAPPALAVLEYTPRNAAKSDVKLSLVGKGIVYDTGGLSLKSTANMCEMKTDCGGAIALLGAFDVLAASDTPFPVVYVGCLAENAVGPESQRNDDIVTSLSGKTIEINNTDAEGRLVLADGVAYTTLHHAPTHVVDMATLTGAQMVATGMHHAGLVSRTQAFEDTIRAAGQRSGDWCFPLLYAPEILMPEFDSKVADMRNSVRSRTNAQSSCAGHFVEQHLKEDFSGEWAHVDIAGPSFRDGRATGFGVALVVELAKTLAK